MSARATAAILLAILGAGCTAPAEQRGGFGLPQPWTPAALSSARYESSPAFSPDGDEVHFFRAGRDYGHYRLQWSRCEGGAWTPPVEPPFAAAPGVLEADPAPSPDGRWLYFVSARGKADGDDLDIWRVERLQVLRWGRAERLPEPVNSPATELLPRPQPDGGLLFGSSRPGGHGQGDIYVATPQADGVWRVENAGPPVSSAANEYEAELSRDGRVLVTVADRGDRSHLYVYDRVGDGWRERGRVNARADVFQVGPLLSPHGDRLLFAQAAGPRKSGEWFVVDLAAGADGRWPPDCR